MTAPGGTILYRLSDSDRLLLEQIRLVMETYFATDIGRITHAHEVTDHALNLLEFIDADPLITLAASYLHDIGIPEAERKFGRCDGKLQEQEGPPVARMLLADVGADEQLVNPVCELVGNHHTPNAINTPEFRILWDADALVNLVGVVVDKKPTAIEAILAKALVTEAGYRMARKLYLNTSDGD
jgi:HD superfamily phosphodiesterase